MSFLGIRVNLVALKLSLLSCLFILVTVTAMAWLVLEQAEQSKVSEMRVRAEVFARSCGEAIHPKLDAFTLHFNTQQLLKEEAVVYAAVLDARGKVLSHSDPRSIGEADASAEARLAMAAKGPLVQRFSERGVEYSDIAVPLLSGSRRIGTARLGFTRGSIAGSLRESKRRIVLIACGTIGLTMLGTFLIAWFMTKDLSVMARAAEAIGRGEFDVQLHLRQKRDEVGQLARAFGQMVQGLKERDFIRNTFGRFVSKEVVEGFLTGKLSLELGGERRELTVLMSDIRGFTEFSEGRPPEEVVKLLNRYLTEMVQVIASQGGTVDKFIGDAILAVFGWPMYHPNHALLAMDAAMAMRERLVAFNDELAREGKPPLGMGIAISSGVALAGNIGTQEKLQYTVIGDTVNLAFRMEEANKELHTDLIVSESVYRATQGDFEFKDLGLVAVRGRKEKAHLFSVGGAKRSP